MIKNYSNDSRLYEACLSLLDTCFPGIKQLADTGKLYHAHWDQVSIPFVHYLKDELVGHLGLIPLHLIINNKTYTAAALHGICVKASFRRQGIFRELMHEAMAYIYHHYDFAFLFTDNASLYEPFGFKRKEENDFVLEDIPTNPRVHTFRKLNLTHPTDLKLMQDLLAKRLPISEHFGIVQEQVIFTLDVLKRAIYYSDALNLLIVYYVKDEVLYLQDLVFIEPVELDIVLASIPDTYKKVVLQFCPDRFSQIKFSSVKTMPEDFLMVSDSFPLDISFLRFPETARC